MWPEACCGGAPWQISWELGSSMFGYLLRRYAPSDTYEVWKLGNAVRVDGTLMGVEDNSKSLLPEWKRGQFSLLFHSAYTMEGKSKVGARLAPGASSPRVMRRPLASDRSSLDCSQPDTARHSPDRCT